MALLASWPCRPQWHRWQHRPKCPRRPQLLANQNGPVNCNDLINQNGLVSRNNLFDHIGLNFIRHNGSAGFIGLGISFIGLGFVGFVGLSLVSLSGLTVHISFVGPIGFSGISGLVGQISLVSLDVFISEISFIDLAASSYHWPIGFISVIGFGLIALSASAASLARQLIGLVSLAGLSTH
jgi:hypothetical protein